MKKTIIMTAIALLIGASTQAQGIIDKIVGIVGNEIIMMSDIENQYIQMASQDAGTAPKGQPPQMKNGEQPPEPPKDKNGNPLPPPDGQGMQGQNGEGHDGKQPPEPPKDKNGNLLPPPDGYQHGKQNSK